MKEMILNNAKWKLLALGLAFIVWLGVVNIANPTITSTREVQVEIVNGDILQDANLAYEVLGKKTATVTYKVRTRDDYRIKTSDFRAYADLSEMYDVTGAIPIHLQVLNNASLIDGEKVSPEVVRIQTEPMQTKEFTVVARPKGKVASGFEKGAISLDPQKVTVQGPQSLVGQINSVGVEFDVEGADSTVEKDGTPGFYDANGNALHLNDSVQILTDSVHCTMEVLRLKEVPLNFVVSGTPADGYRFTGADATVAAVNVAGDTRILDSLSEIRIQTPALNVADAEKNVETDIDISDYLPEGVTVSGLDSTEIHVVLNVKKLDIQRFNVNTSDITLTGENSSYRYTVESASMGMRIQGLPDVLKKLKVSDLSLTADVSSLTPGVHTITVKAEPEDGCEIVTYPSVTVHVSDGNGSANDDENSGSEEEESGSAGAETKASGKNGEKKTEEDAADSGAASGN